MTSGTSVIPENPLHANPCCFIHDPKKANHMMSHVVVLFKMSHQSGTKEVKQTVTVVDSPASSTDASQLWLFCSLCVQNAAGGSKLT